MATLEGIDHVGIAVADLAAAVEAYTRLCGGGPVHRSVIAADGVEVVIFEAGAQRIELLGARRADSAISRFLVRRGGGLHHVAYRVSDVQAALDHYSWMGLRLIDTRPRPGAEGRLVAFLHPGAAEGVLSELCQLTSGGVSP
jgi:methylmalonyl-CoA/ethylmalonyl-CoA epimerase